MGAKKASYPRNQFTPEDGETTSYYTDDEKAPAWCIAVYSTEPDVLHLILGDMGYHEIGLDVLLTNGPTRTAEIFDETGAAAEIEAVLRAYLAVEMPRLCPECGADLDGNDPHGPTCSRGDHDA